MTTKELTRRLQYYRSLDRAAYLFNFYDDIDYVFRIISVNTDGTKDVVYSLSYIYLVDDTLESAMIDRFSHAQFIVQLRYFHSFFSRASKTQQDYIKASSLVDNLLNFDK